MATVSKAFSLSNRGYTRFEHINEHLKSNLSLKGVKQLSRWDLDNRHTFILAKNKQTNKNNGQSHREEAKQEVISSEEPSCTCVPPDSSEGQRSKVKPRGPLPRLWQQTHVLLLWTCGNVVLSDVKAEKKSNERQEPRRDSHWTIHSLLAVALLGPLRASKHPIAS